MFQQLYQFEVPKNDEKNLKKNHFSQK